MQRQSEIEFWKKSIIVFDTSALLNFFSLSDSALESLKNETLKGFNGKIHIPNHTLFETNKNYHKPISQVKSGYREISTHLKSIDQHCQQIINKTSSKERHPTLDVHNLETLKIDFINLKSKIDEEVATKIDLLETQGFESIDKLIDEQFLVSPITSFKEKSGLMLEGKFRADNQIPPGYLDFNSTKKKGFQRIGDLIIWKETISISKNQDSSVIFIVDDEKEDWWEIIDKKSIDARNELKQEFLEETFHEIKFLTLPRFLEEANKYLETKFGEEIIEELKLIQTSNKPSLSRRFTVTATNQETEPWRIMRLYEVLEYILKHYDKDEIRIEVIHDHKGQLTITWKEEPTDAKKLLVESAWEYQHEPKEHVYHKFT